MCCFKNKLYVKQVHHRSNTFNYIEIKCLHPNTTLDGTYTRVLDNGTEEILREYQAQQLLYSFNTTLRLYCDGGINSLGKYNEIRCLANSTWSGPEPTCRGIL